MFNPASRLGARGCWLVIVVAAEGAKTLHFFTICVIRIDEVTIRPSPISRLERPTDRRIRDDIPLEMSY